MIIEFLATGVFFLPLAALYGLLVGVTEGTAWAVRALGRWRGRRAA